MDRILARAEPGDRAAAGVGEDVITSSDSGVLARMLCAAALNGQTRGFDLRLVALGWQQPICALELAPSHERGFCSPCRREQ